MGRTVYLPTFWPHKYTVRPMDPRGIDVFATATSKEKPKLLSKTRHVEEREVSLKKPGLSLPIRSSGQHY